MRQIRSLSVLAVGIFIAGFSWASGSAESVASAPGLTERMAILIIQLGVILFAARLGNKLFEKMHLPGVLGELCSGILIGPYLLGSIGFPLPGLENGLFYLPPMLDVGVGVSPELYGLCTVASIILLFLVGIETDLEMFLRYSAVGSLVGIGGVLASFLTGLGAGMLFLDQPWDAPACIFLGVMSTATSVSITARILSERRKLDSQEGVTILAGAVIDDVLGIIMLAIGMGLINAKASGDDVQWAHIGVIAVKIFSIWAGATVIGIMISRSLARILKPLGSHGEVAILSLGLALVLGGIFETAHLACIIGAYVMGLSFSRTELSQMIQEKLHTVYVFLVPVFFAVMGMMVDVRDLLNPSLLLFGLVYTLGAILSKFIGCGLPTFLFGFNALGASRIGLGMIPRGEVALIVAGIAKSSGMLGADGNGVFNVAIIMTLVTTLMAPPALIGAFKINLSGIQKRFRKNEKEIEPLVSFSFPNHEVAQLILNKIDQNLLQEGFFTHTLNRSHNLMQARKDNVVINIELQDSVITFESKGVTTGFIHAITSESITEFEQTLKELRKPITGSQIQLSIEQSEDYAQKKRQDILLKHLCTENILPDVAGTTPEEVITEILKKLTQTGAIEGSTDDVSQLLLEREKMMPTGVGHGVACPHVRTDSVKNLVSVIAISKNGIDFKAEDNQLCKIILLTLTPKSINSPYMTFISAALANLSRDSVRATLVNAKTPREIYKAIIER